MNQTVDRLARDQGAQVFRNFIAGRVSNFDFERAAPITHDEAISAIWSSAWVLYDDHKEHRLIGPYRLSPSDKRMCLRWLLFLHSDRPYRWPSFHLPGIDPASRVGQSFFQRLFSSARNLQEANVKRFLAAGYYPVWPFICVTDYKSVLHTPRLLRGT